MNQQALSQPAKGLGSCRHRLRRTPQTPEEPRLRSGSESAHFFLYRLLRTEMSCRYVGQCRYFDTTGGCDLLFSQTAKHERLTFTGNRTTQPSRRRTRCRETAPECRHGKRQRQAPADPEPVIDRDGRSFHTRQEFIICAATNQPAVFPQRSSAWCRTYGVEMS